jgi:hypothetical protein
VVFSEHLEEAEMKARHRVPWVIVLGGLFAFCASGCVYKPVQIGGPMFGSEALKGKKLARLGEGKACSSHILYLIPTGDAGMEAALEQLTKKAVWTADVVTVEAGTSFWLLGWSECTRVVGYGAMTPATKFKTTLLAEPASPPPDEPKAPAAEPAAPESSVVVSPSD